MTRPFIPDQETLNKLMEWHKNNPVDFIKMHNQVVEDIANKKNHEAAEIRNL